MLDSIMESYPKKMKQLCVCALADAELLNARQEDAGVETDEDAKVDLSAFK